MAVRSESASSLPAMFAATGKSQKRSMPALFRSPKAVGALVLVVLIVGGAVFAPLIAPYDPASQQLTAKLQRPCADHWLGTDQFGRDTWSRILFGARVSLVTGAGAVTIGALLGIVFGLIAGYRGGWVEMVMMSLIDVLLGFRTYLLAIMVAAILGPSTANMLVAVGLAMFPEIAGITRAEVLSVKRRDFVTAAVACGATHLRIMFRHVAPQVIAPLIVVATFNIANAIIVEASLSFLGLGPSPPTPAWGLMISDGRRFILGNPWVPAIPGFAIMLTVLAFNLLGDALRDVQDPRSRRR